jgi:protein TonB
MRILGILLACAPAVLAQSPESLAARPHFTAPVLVHRVEPEYTADARVKKVEGVTVVYLEITPEGKVQNARVTKSLEPGLDSKAVAAVSQWRFQPAKKDGQQVTVQATVSIDFRLPRYPEFPSASPRPPAPPLADDEWSLPIVH